MKMPFWGFSVSVTWSDRTLSALIDIVWQIVGTWFLESILPRHPTKRKGASPPFAAGETPPFLVRCTRSVAAQGGAVRRASGAPFFVAASVMVLPATVRAVLPAALTPMRGAGPRHSTPTAICPPAAWSLRSQTSWLAGGLLT